MKSAPILLILMIFLSSMASGQKVMRYNFGKPVTVESYVKEVILWENGAKKEADSYAGDLVKIFLSDSLVQITEIDTTISYPIEEIRVDDAGNITFFTEEKTTLHWIRETRIFQIEPVNSTVEILYYIE